MFSFESCCAAWVNVKNMSAGKPIDNQTRLFKVGEHFEVRYYGVTLVSWFRDGRCKMSSGGAWRRQGVRLRLERFGVGHVVVVRGKPYWEAAAGRALVPFFDGMIVGDLTILNDSKAV
jgi:hypothetical protein